MIGLDDLGLAKESKVWDKGLRSIKAERSRKMDNRIAMAKQESAAICAWFARKRVDEGNLSAAKQEQLWAAEDSKRARREMGIE